MRLGPFELRRTQAAAEPSTRRSDDLGASGTINLDGFLQEHEYLHELVGARGLDEYERMRSSDGSVQEALGHITAPIVNATWDIEPAGRTPLDLEVAEAVRRAYFTWPTQAFDEYLDEALDMLVFGHYVFERSEQVVVDGLVWDQAGHDVPATTEARPFLTWKRWAPRMPRTIARWNADQSDLVSVEQWVWKDSGYDQITIPADRLLVFTHRRRGDDFTGRSLLRAARKHWLMKELVEKIEVVALERHGVGVWVGYVPQSRADDEKALARVEEILKNLRAGAYSYIVAPGPKATSAAAGQDGYVFEVVSPQGDPPQFESAKTYHRGEIKGAILVRFSELGHAQVGARATGDTQSEVWKDALEWVAGYFAQVNRQAIRWFVDVNYGPDVPAPALVARDIESKSLQEFADAHAKLVAAGAVEPDQSYRRHVREELGAPPEDDPEAVDELRNPPTPDPKQQPVDDLGRPIEQE